jgi:hypothetical protein
LKPNVCKRSAKKKRSNVNDSNLKSLSRCNKRSSVSNRWKLRKKHLNW